VRGDGDALQLGRDSKAVTFLTRATGKKKLNRRESDDERCTMYPTARTIAGKRKRAGPGDSPTAATREKCTKRTSLVHKKKHHS
jgi:hypothetical protein